MNQPYVIVKADDQHQYLSSIYPTGKGAKWVPVGSRRREVLLFSSLDEAEKFCETFVRLEGIKVYPVTKWVESMEEIFEILGIQDYPPKERALDAVALLWHALPAYPPHQPFQPVEILGEPLSKTILKERR